MMDDFILAFLVGECCLLALLLLFHPLQQNRTANRWLGAAIMVAGAAFAANFVDSKATDRFSAFFVRAAADSLFLFGPMLLLAARNFVSPVTKDRSRDWLHFLPFIGAVTSDVLVASGDTGIATFPLLTIGDYQFWIRDLVPFHLAVYIALSWRLLAAHRRNVELITSSAEKTGLDWLRRMLLVFLLPIAFWINDALSIVPALTVLNRPLYATSLLLLGVFGMRQEAVFPYDGQRRVEIATLIASNGVDAPHGNAKPTNRRLSDEKLAELGARLDDLMRVERLFLDPDLTLARVADELGVSIHDASFVINAAKGENFYGFVNRHRVDESKRLLASPAALRLNMLGIAFESGFNSKTAFNVAFKKIAGCTPSEFMSRNA